jgi:hypothetical protein
VPKTIKNGNEQEPHSFRGDRPQGRRTPYQCTAKSANVKNPDGNTSSEYGKHQEQLQKYQTDFRRVGEFRGGREEHHADEVGHESIL